MTDSRRLREWATQSLERARHAEALAYSRVMVSQDAIPAYREAQDESHMWMRLLDILSHDIVESDGIHERTVLKAVEAVEDSLRASHFGNGDYPCIPIARTALLALIPSYNGARSNA